MESIGYRIRILDIHPTEDVITQAVTVDISQFKHVITAWKKALNNTRYSPNKNLGLDGVTYQFYAHYNFFGETWSPNKGIPFKLVKLGKILEELVSIGDDDERIKIIHQANIISNEIINTKP